MKNYSYIDFLAEFTINSAHPGGKSLTREIFNEEIIEQETTILDVGCGTGETASLLASTFQCNMYAIENHPIMLKKAEERFRNESLSIKLFEGSVEKLPFESETFDYILIESVLSFVNVKTALKECRRVLKNGGILILNEMTLLTTLSKDNINTLKAFYRFSECNDEQDWKDHLHETGFEHILKLSINHEGDKEVNELQLTIDMDPKLFDILDEHERILEEFKGKMGNVVLRCKK